MAQRDPFYAVKDKVQSALLTLRGTLTRADSTASNGGQPAEVEPILSEAREEMSQVHIDVKDLSQTITIVEENRTRFPSIDNRELDSRRAFVTDAKTSLAQCDEQIKRISSKAQQAANRQRKQLISNNDLGGSSRFANSASAEAGHANDDFVASSRSQALMYEKEQDTVLISMGDSLDRLKGISETISQELIESEHQLTALDDELNTAQGTMQTVLKKMDKLLKSSDRGRLCCIVILFFVAIALFFGIIYS